MRTWTLALVITAISGCTSSGPAPSPRPAGAALDGVRRVVVVTSGESRFAVVQATCGSYLPVPLI